MSDKTYNVESRKGTVTIPTSTTVTTGTVTLEDINGLTNQIFFTTPSMTGTDTPKLQIVNSAGAVFMDSGTVAESVTTILGTQVALVSGDKMIATASGTQSAAADIVYDIRFLR
ncbi:hypothetical protein KJ836_02650 [Patescibacteria group bacterium]|nr:hypothetical protein [Patescibacteria group bacterium]